MLDVRWCAVDQCLENVCGGSHTKVDVSSGLEAAEAFQPATEVVGVAAFLGDQRVLPPAGTDEVVCFDLDSTLRNTKQRHHLLPKNRPEVFAEDPAKAWLDYALAGELDEPIVPAVLLYKLLLWQRLPGSYARRHQTHIVSGSDEGARAETQAWLRKRGLWFDALRLRTAEDRAAGDTSLDYMKIEYVRGLQAKGLKVTLFFEDWAPLAKSIQEATSVPVVVLNPMYDLETDRPSDNPTGNAVEFAHEGDSGVPLEPVEEFVQSETGDCLHVDGEDK